MECRLFQPDRRSAGKPERRLTTEGRRDKVLVADSPRLITNCASTTTSLLASSSPSSHSLADEGIVADPGRFSAGTAGAALRVRSSIRFLTFRSLAVLRSLRVAGLPRPTEDKTGGADHKADPAGHTHARVLLGYGAVGGVISVCGISTFHGVCGIRGAGLASGLATSTAMAPRRAPVNEWVTSG